MKTILAPIDFSPASGSVLEAASALARAMNGRIVMLHAVRPQILSTEYGVEIERLNVSAERSAANELERLREGLEKAGIETEVVQTFGFPVPDILEQAGKLPADYIVIGSHGHTALYNLLVGSTAGGVLKRARCPVLVVPPGQTIPAAAFAALAEAAT